MEGQSARESRPLRRCYQASRLEEEVLAAAYERVYPQRRQPLTTHAVAQSEVNPGKTEPQLARRA